MEGACMALTALRARATPLARLTDLVGRAVDAVPGEGWSPINLPPPGQCCGKRLPRSQPRVFTCAGRPIIKIGASRKD
jgi:hypothetical protein